MYSCLQAWYFLYYSYTINNTVLINCVDFKDVIDFICKKCLVLGQKCNYLYPTVVIVLSLHMLTYLISLYCLYFSTRSD